MNAEERAKLIRQAGKLYTLGLTVEKRRKILRQLVERGVPHDSAQMRTALEMFRAADRTWKQLEQEYLNSRNQGETERCADSGFDRSQAYLTNNRHISQK